MTLGEYLIAEQGFLKSKGAKCVYENPWGVKMEFDSRDEAIKNINQTAELRLRCKELTI